MKVSVIIPNYNHSNFLEERIESVINQTFQNIEILIFDDGSKDSSKNIIDKYANHPKVVHVEINEHNIGSPFKQWKKGFNLVSGDLIWIAESDDYADISFLKKLTPEFQEQSVNIAFCRSMIIDENNNELGLDTWGKEKELEKWDKSFIMEGKIFLQNHQLYKNCIVNASSAVFRQSLLNNPVLFSNTLKRNGDWFFWNQLLLNGSVSYVSEPLNFWRQHLNTTRKLGDFEVEKEKFYEQLEVISKTIKLLPKNTKIKQQNWMWLAERWISRFSYENLLKISYIFPPLPIRLAFIFYIKLIKRLFFAFIQSLKKQMLK